MKKILFVMNTMGRAGAERALIALLKTLPREEYDISLLVLLNRGEIFDEILKLLLEKGKGIELNTGGIKSGMHAFHPCMDILKRYRELGGEIITVGSDSHDGRNIAAHFDRAADVLRECGFGYYCVFEKRRPEFLGLR